MIGELGPGQSKYLLHFCGRPGLRSTRSATERAMLSPGERMNSILWQRQIFGSVDFAGGREVVCFAESPLEHVVWMVKTKGWAPWALMFRREDIRTLGGHPAWPATHDEIEQLSFDLKHWAVRLGSAPGKNYADWLHEHEWRVRTPTLDIMRTRPRALLVGEMGWKPELRGDNPHLPFLWTITPRLEWTGDDETPLRWAPGAEPGEL